MAAKTPAKKPVAVEDEDEEEIEDDGTLVDLEDEDDDGGFGFGDDDDDVFAAPPPKPKTTAAAKPPPPEEDPSKFNVVGGSAQATARLLKDLRALKANDTSKFGISAEPQGDNLYTWTVKLFGFDGQLEKDLEAYAKRSGAKEVELEMKFRSDYPFTPPFIRVVKPRFQFHTGHVTIGGSICMELLTRSGWLPANDIESILVQIRAEMLAGNARLDLHNSTPYSDREAQDAFERVARQHGWS
ncbi:ubiquitin-conjugating enzyme E2 25 [Pelomyxa schiedti]|nr:ubiquitin-conjugating enzyme E2 25 [Pelomyxa schiedti]